MGLVWYWKNSALYSIARAGLSSLPKTYFFAPTSCYHRISFFQQKAKRHAEKPGESIMNSQLLVSWFYVANNKIYIANIFHLIKRFAVLLYVSTSTSSSVNKCRKQLFFKKRTFTCWYTTYNRCSIIAYL